MLGENLINERFVWIKFFAVVVSYVIVANLELLLNR